MIQVYLVLVFWCTSLGVSWCFVFCFWVSILSTLVVGFAEDLLGDLFPPVWVDRSCFDAFAIILFTRFTTSSWLISFILPIKKNNDKRLLIVIFLLTT